MTEMQRRYCKSNGESKRGSIGANLQLLVLHKCDIWRFVQSVGWIQSEHLRSEPQPDHNVLPSRDSAGGDINNMQGTQESEWEEFSVGQPAASSVVVHSMLWFISLLKSLSRLINCCDLTCSWLAIITRSFSYSVLWCLTLNPKSLLNVGIMSVYHSQSWCFA